MIAGQLALFPVAFDGLVVVGCGAAKLDHAAPAGQLYTGQHFRACMAAAVAVAPREGIWILSAKHGLLALEDEVEPYDMTVGDAGAVTWGELAAQATARTLSSYPVMALCSRRYVELLERAWRAPVTAPLAGLGIGQQRHVLAGLRSGAVS